MKKRGVLRNQAVKKRKKRRLAAIWSMAKAVSSGLLKVSCLAALLALLSLGFLFGYQYLLASPYLKLERIEVRGVSEELKEELVKMADVKPGAGLLALNLNALQQRMERHPWIKAVRLERRFPHSLLIEADEQVPMAVAVMDKLYYVNREGEIFKELNDSESADFPLITGVSREDPFAREKVLCAFRVMKTLASEEGAWSLKGLSEVHVARRQNVSLYFDGLGAEVKLTESGVSDRFDELKRIVRDLRRSGRIQQVTAIDLNYPDGAVVSFREG